MPSIEAPVADWVTIPDLYRDPFPIYERLRAEGGVHWVPAVGRYLITSYAGRARDRARPGRSSRRTSRARCRSARWATRCCVATTPSTTSSARPGSRCCGRASSSAPGPSVFERNAARYLDEFIAKGPGADLVWDFAAPYAAENLREIIGLHNATQHDLQRWSQTMIDATGNYADDPDVWAAGERSFDEVDIALDEMLRWHAGAPRPLAAVVAPAHPRLRDADRAHPRQRQDDDRRRSQRAARRARSGGLGTSRPSRAACRGRGRPGAVAVGVRRGDPLDRADRPVLTAGDARRGARGCAAARPARSSASASSPPTATRTCGPTRTRFDIQREVKPHLAFGKGVHVCLGAWVARAEVADVALPMLFRRLDGLSLSTLRRPPRSAAGSSAA